LFAGGLSIAQQHLSLNKGRLFCFVLGGVHQLGFMAFGLAVQKFLNIE
jgi:hypothetical protein